MSTNLWEKCKYLGFPIVVPAPRACMKKGFNNLEYCKQEDCDEVEVI